MVSGYFGGRQFNARDVQQRDATILQMQSDGQRLAADIADQNATLTALRAELTTTRAALDAITPSLNVYNIIPNQSLIAADGRLTIGMIGPPGNEGLNLNINGKQQKVAAGDVIRVSPDPATACQVQIQSFDMFKAVLVASCAAAKSQ